MVSISAASQCNRGI